MTSSGNIYLLQYGSYINKEVMNENIKNLDNYLVYEHDDKYYVYIGVYVHLDTARKMKKYYENEKIYTYIKNDYLGNSDIIKQIKELDKKILDDDNYEEILKNNKKILDLLKKQVS